MRWSVCSFNQLPKWMQDNEYLKHGYRPPLGSFASCWWSIFRSHTETVNIWTHLLASLYFFWLFVCDVIYFWNQNLSWVDIIARGIFHLGAILCLGFSSAYHLFSCHSYPVAKLFSKLDYSGIALLITGSFIAWLQEAFYCHTSYKVLYFSGAAILCSLTLVTSLWDKFGTPQFRPYRAGIFAALGLSKVLPFSHWLFSQNLVLHDSLRVSFICLVSMALLYLSKFEFFKFLIESVDCFPGSPP